VRNPAKEGEHTGFCSCGAACRILATGEKAKPHTYWKWSALQDTIMIGSEKSGWFAIKEYMGGDACNEMYKATIAEQVLK
jgi:hypothetical protein